MAQLGWLRLLLLVIGLQFALLVNNPLAQEPAVESPTKTPADTRVAEQLRTQLAAQQQEVVELRAQLKTMRRYDQRLLSTVYWSLGTTVFIALVLVGYGWFVNLRVYERDKAALERDLRMFVQNQLTEIRSHLESETRTRHSELLKEVHRAASAAAEPLQEEVNRIQDDSKRFKRDFFKLEARFWTTEKNLGDALEAYTDALKLTPTLNSFDVFRILNEIHSVLEVISRDNPNVKPSTVKFSELEKVLEKVPDEHSELVERIRTILMEMKRRPGVDLPPLSRR